MKEYFIRMIEEYFRKYTPEEIYYKILYELFKADLELDSISIDYQQDMSLLQTSEIWRTLFNYQQKGFHFAYQDVAQIQRSHPC